jgi:hypothetical protein
MMRNFQLAIPMMLSVMCVNAQSNSDNKSNNLTASANITTASTASVAKYAVSETPEQARKQVMQALNLYRGYSVSVDDSSEPEQPTSTDKKDFSEYLAKMNQVIQRRLQTLETDNIKDAEQMAEKSSYLRALSLLKSAACLTDRNTGSFVKQKDLEGTDITAFNLENLKGNSRYGFIEGFKEGYARIKKDQVFGFLNYCGDEVIPCQYELAEAFNSGRALVKKVDWYYIDAQGQESEMLQNITNAKPVKYGISVAQFKDGKYAFIDNRYDATKAPVSGYYDEITPFIGQEIFRVRQGTKFGLMNLQGIVKLDPSYEVIETSNTKHLYKVSQNGKLGLVDTLWRIKFSPAFDIIGGFNDKGLAVTKDGDNYRLISANTYKSSEKYKSIATFGKNGLAQIQDANGNFGLINIDLQEVVTTQYYNIGEFNDLGLASACRFDKKCGFINTKGTEVIAPLYEEVGQFNKYGVVVVRELTKDGNKNKTCKSDIVYNKYGQVIIAKANEKEVTTMKIRYEIMDTLHSGIYVTAKMFVDEEMQGFHLIDAKSYRLVTAIPYQSITPLDINGLMRVQQNNLWGFLDSTGKVVLSPLYKEIRKHADGFYACKNDSDKYGFIDKKGKITIPFEYEDVKYFRQGHCIVARGKEKWGLINKFNAKIVPLNFKTVTTKEGQYEMSDDKGHTYIIDDKGDCVQNCQKFEELRRKANQ